MSGQQPADYAALRTFAPITGGGGIAAVTPQFIGNDALEPEKGAELEIGFEAGLFNSRFGIDFTYYNTRTQDAILSRNLPPSLGFPGSQFVNAGEIRNQGIEVQLSGAAYQSDDINVELALNLATNNNEIVDLGGIDQGTGFIAAGSQRRVPGFPVASWFRRKVVSATLVGTGRDARATDPMCDGGDPNGKKLPNGTPLEIGGPPVPCAGAPRLYLGHVTPDLEVRWGPRSPCSTAFASMRWWTGRPATRSSTTTSGRAARCSTSAARTSSPKSTIRLSSPRSSPAARCAPSSSATGALPSCARCPRA